MERGLIFRTAEIKVFTNIDEINEIRVENNYVPIEKDPLTEGGSCMIILKDCLKELHLVYINPELNGKEVFSVVAHEATHVMQQERFRFHFYKNYIPDSENQDVMRDEFEAHCVEKVVFEILTQLEKL